MSRHEFTSLIDFDRFSEYVVVKDLKNLIAVPASLPLEVAAILPSGGLSAYAAVCRARPFVRHRIDSEQGARAHRKSGSGINAWSTHCNFTNSTVVALCRNSATFNGCRQLQRAGGGSRRTGSVDTQDSRLFHGR